MTRKKWLFLAVGLAVFLSACGIFLLAFLSYKIRDIKGPLISALQNNIDGEIRIGEAKAVLLPTGIDLVDVTLYAPGENQPSALVKKAEIRFNLIPLLQKKIETRLFVIEPVVHFRRAKDGTSNMERIFLPLIAGEKKDEVSNFDQLWWRRLAVNKLVIQDGRFSAVTEGKPETTELTGVNVDADQIRFESAREPAKIELAFQLPKISSEPMKLFTKMFFDETKQSLTLKDGKFRWGSAEIRFQGDALLPGDKQKEVGLNLALDSDPIDLKKLGQSLREPLPASGKVAMKGTVQGTPFAPVLTLHLDSPALNVGGKSISSFVANIVKKAEPIEVTDASFGIYGGSIHTKGKLYSGSAWGGDLNVSLRSLSLAAASGNKGNPARLSGDLQVTSKNLSNPSSLSGGGEITVGPIPLPVIDMKSKIRVAEVLAAGTQTGRLINLGMLSNSQNVIGTQIPQIRARVKIAGGNIFLTPFSMGNGHFNASGSGTIFQQKSLQASGTFTLNSGVTAQLLPDKNFRSVVTSGKGVLSFPFTASGPLDSPNISVDSSHFRSMVAKATAMGLANILAGGVQPNQMLNSALKNTPLGDPKNPLSRILGTAAPQQPAQDPNASNATPPKRTTSTGTKTSDPKGTANTKPSSSSGNKLVDQILFGR